MSPPRPFLVFSLCALCLQGWAQSPAPAPKASPAAGKATPEAPINSKEEVDAEFIILAGLPIMKGKEEILRYSRQTYVKSDLIKDVVLRQWVRLAVSRIEDQPDKAALIREEHLIKVAEYFLGQAQEALQANRIDEAFKLAQITVRISPANAKGKLFFANLLHSNFNRTDDAIQTLRHGLEFLNVNDPLGRDYLDRYFQLLQLRERDAEVIDQSLNLLQKGKDLPPPTRQAIALSAATSLYWVGRYAESVNIININNLDANVGGLLLKAKALFDGGKTQEAVGLLESKTSQFSGSAKDALYAQQARFQILLGKPKVALTVTNERIAIEEKAPFPHIQRLMLLDRLNLKDEYDKELQLIAERFASNAGAMIALANFAAERGYDGLTSTLAEASASRGFERSTFAALHLEALLNGQRSEQVIAQYQQVNAADRGYFSSNQPIVNALLGISYHARPKKDEVAAKSDRNIGDRYLKEFLTAKNLGPEAYRSVGKHLKRIRATEAAVRVLEAGVQLFPRYAQLRADYIGARILAGQTDSYGTRKSVAEELEELLKMRRPSPLIWHEALSWLRSEAKLPKEQAERLDRAIAPLARPDLDQEALNGR
jgi:hypothetical protein